MHSLSESVIDSFKEQEKGNGYGSIREEMPTLSIHHSDPLKKIPSSYSEGRVSGSGSKKIFHPKYLPPVQDWCAVSP